ncbi:hypothetical protein [Aliivibrio fischeri]|uniref:hypothetical protein n=1 Tax=Aliivibrio fischeri TaxID=668 RepID=UPI0012D8D514|nr:hypothetical protein [Aliivibrio fischeri]MUJ22003.1 hypothetical protein [Aliivibrio fischeri]
MAKYNVNSFDVSIVNETSTYDNSDITVVYASLDLQGTTGNRSRMHKKFRLCSDLNVRSVERIEQILNDGLSDALNNGNRFELGLYPERSYVFFQFSGQEQVKFSGNQI